MCCSADTVTPKFCYIIAENVAAGKKLKDCFLSFIRLLLRNVKNKSHGVHIGKTFEITPDTLQHATRDSKMKYGEHT